MSGYQYEPGRVQAYGRPPVPPAPSTGYGWSPGPPTPPMPAPTPRPSHASLAALILAGTALLVAVVALVVVLVGGAGLGPGEGGGSGWNAPLTGRLDSAPTNDLAGGTLQSAVSQVILEDGGNVTQLTCPATPSVAQGVVTVCHATIDGDPWAVVVLFEDADGTFTLDLI
ncbi:DUF4333 domain-containing protein [uncultured Friedmanniella sp.]|uniref:DUF4333 domain-containing protein n=1 Tax=uncultured Friedmanniella sp. TaxID=335381 RepID=UPI0035CCA6B8